MMQFMLCRDNVTQTGGKELLHQWQENPESWIWLNLHQADINEEQELLSQHFALDSGAISEAQRNRHPPNFEAFKDYIYLLLKPLDAESDSARFFYHATGNVRRSTFSDNTALKRITLPGESMAEPG